MQYEVIILYPNYITKSFDKLTDAKDFIKNQGAQKAEIHTYSKGSYKKKLWFYENGKFNYSPWTGREE